MDNHSAHAYRKDIDSLRALAVLAVMAFHVGFVRNGFLGVDVFFVISGFLITGIIHKELQEGTFTIGNFYLRRTRRIIPLTLAVCTVALVVGVVTMLPDDLENLAQSVVATNVFCNNILQSITTRNYWDVVNEFKPLMHTWSLGVEEQYYLLYPLVFALISGHISKWMGWIIAGLAVLSLAAYFSPAPAYLKFYMMPFRFWELAVGGLVAIAVPKCKVSQALTLPALAGLITLLWLDTGNLPPWSILVAVVLLTAFLLWASDNTNPILRMEVLSWTGRISFSLYMWHQVVLAFTRYFWIQKPGIGVSCILLAITFALSTASYYWIEQPFRNRRRVGNRSLLWTLGVVFAISTGAAFFIYSRAGVTRDVPELDISATHAVRHMHSAYTDRIWAFNRDFSGNGKIRVLVAGNSFGRDWANVLLESPQADRIEISYAFLPGSFDTIRERAKAADIVFYAYGSDEANDMEKLGIPKEKLWVVGTKNFGASNGRFFNYQGEDYFAQRARIDRAFIETNAAASEEFKGRYIDYISPVIDDKGCVPVFTPSGKFISQDCRHLTRAGAQFYAKLLEPQIDAILGTAKPVLRK